MGSNLADAPSRQMVKINGSGMAQRIFLSFSHFEADVAILYPIGVSLSFKNLGDVGDHPYISPSNSAAKFVLFDKPVQRA